MVVDVESRAESVTGVKMARACDVCRKGSRASWYCPADDAFLCQSCDASVHSANQLAKRHERVRLQSSPSDKTTSVWYEGFRRKARTPRNKLLQIQDAMNTNFPLVPELGGENDGFFSFSSTDENEESLNCCVPVFDPFSDMMVIDDDDDDDSFGLVPGGGGGKEDMEEKAVMEDDVLFGFLPLDMNLTMDVESLLDEEQHLGVKEEDNFGFEINKQALKRVKHEEEVAKCENGGIIRESDGEESEDEERKMSLFLRLDYEAVITAWGRHGSPWEAGIKPEISSGDCWPEGQLGGYTCPSHAISGFEDSAVGSVTRKQGRGGGGSDGEREARVLRYKEKRRTRLFAKKIRYEVRKLNAEQRPRIKGRFVKRTSL